MNKTTIIVVCFIALCITQNAQSDLMVKELVPGQKVTLDDLTGNYWYWNLADFANMTYAEQITAIDGLGTYGYIAGGWHMATQFEMEELWDNYTGPQLAESFAGTVMTPLNHFARYDRTYLPGWTEWHTCGILMNGGAEKFLLGPHGVADWHGAYWLGAWVTTDAPVVPVPPAVILAASGLLTSALGLKRLRRKHQEPSQI